MRHLGTQIPLKGRKLLATGLIISKIIYMLPVWGRTPPTNIKKLQRIVNKTARYVLNKGKKWKTNKLMTELNWLRVDEMVVYHSLITLWKILKNRTPKQMAENFEIDNNWKIETTKPRLKTAECAFRWRSTKG